MRAVRFVARLLALFRRKRTAESRPFATVERLPGRPATASELREVPAQAPRLDPFERRSRERGHVRRNWRSTGSL